MKIIRTGNYKASQVINNPFNDLITSYARKVRDGDMSFDEALEVVQSKAAEMFTNELGSSYPRPMTYELPDTPMGLGDDNPIPGVDY